MSQSEGKIETTTPRNWTNWLRDPDAATYLCDHPEEFGPALDAAQPFITKLMQTAGCYPADRWRRYGVVYDDDDFRSIAATAIWDAVRRYDPTRGVMPMSYIAPYVIGYLRRARRDCLGLHVSRALFNQLRDTQQPLPWSIASLSRYTHPEHDDAPPDARHAKSPEALIVNSNHEEYVPVEATIDTQDVLSRINLKTRWIVLLSMRRVNQMLIGRTLRVSQAHVSRTLITLRGFWDIIQNRYYYYAWHDYQPQSHLHAMAIADSIIADEDDRTAVEIGAQVMSAFQAWRQFQRRRKPQPPESFDDAVMITVTDHSATPLVNLDTLTATLGDLFANAAPTSTFSITIQVTEHHKPFASP